MLEILQNLSGKRHRLRMGSRTINRRRQVIAGAVKDDTATNQDIKEEDVISKTTMLQIPRANEMVFGKGNPIWAGNQLAMPYSYQIVMGNPLKDFENPEDYSLATVPTTMNTMDFNLLSNVPNFMQMVMKRVDQAKMAKHVRDLYRKYNKRNGQPLGEDDLLAMDQEELSQDLMRAINEQMAFNAQVTQNANAKSNAIDPNQVLSGKDAADAMAAQRGAQAEKEAVQNTAVLSQMQHFDGKKAQREAKDYAQGNISKDDLNNEGAGNATTVAQALIEGYAKQIHAFENDDQFKVVDGSLQMDGHTMIKFIGDDSRAVEEQMQKSNGGDDGDNLSIPGFSAPDGGDGGSGEKAVMDDLDLNNEYEIEPAWVDYLASKDNWKDLIGGSYDAEVAGAYRRLTEVANSGDESQAS